jgi:hypothetical protein
MEGTAEPGGVEGLCAPNQRLPISARSFFAATVLRGPA